MDYSLGEIMLNQVNNPTHGSEFKQNKVYTKEQIELAFYSVLHFLESKHELYKEFEKILDADKFSNDWLKARYMIACSD
jgi:hypothetical protein